jgi:formate hydrogenlyase transcriptional activator
VRVIAATNQDLWSMVQEKKFRADLYYRLNVFPITLPPLRERGDDIPLLIEHFVEKFAGRQGKWIERIPDEVMEALTRYSWPGNIRELQNVIERAVIMTTGSELSLRATADLTRDEQSAPIRTLADAERAHIRSTLRETKGVVGGRRGAASQLGLPRTSLLARMQRLGISNESSAQRTEQSDRPLTATASERSQAPARSSDRNPEAEYLHASNRPTISPRPHCPPKFA